MRPTFTVDDASSVSRVESVRHLRDDAGDLVHWHAAASESCRQRLPPRLPLVVRHRDERLAGMVADLVHRCDMGMIERTGGTRFPQQAGRSFRIMNCPRRQEFERDASLAARMPRGRVEGATPACTADLYDWQGLARPAGSTHRTVDRYRRIANGSRLNRWWRVMDGRSDSVGYNPCVRHNDRAESMMRPGGPVNG